MRKAMKVILVGCLVTTMWGCTKGEEQKGEQTTTPAVTTTIPVTTMSKEEEQLALFNQYNQLTFEMSEGKAPFESGSGYLNLKVHNGMSQEIEVQDIRFYIETGSQGFYGYGDERLIRANADKSYIVEIEKWMMDKYKNGEKPNYIFYSFVLGDELIELDLRKQKVTISKYTKPKEFVSVEKKGTYPVIPYIPNHGITIFTWEEYGNRVYDYLPGLESEVCEQSLAESVGVQRTLYDAVNKLPDNQIYYLQGINELSEEMVEYADKIFKYYGQEYITDLNDPRLEKIEYVEPIILYTNKDAKCAYTYCVPYAGNVDFSFTSEDIAKVGDRKLSESEIVKFVKENENLRFYIRGLYEPLSKELISKYQNIFDYRMSIEGYVPLGADKPVIYLYPESEMDISVKLEHNGVLNTTYPVYKDGWKVRAKSDGTLYNYADGQEYSYLFWEGEAPAYYDMSEGFVVKREDSVAFLQEKLAYLGLTPREYNEFIVYWLPYLNKHPYNLITFQEERYTNVWKLNISPEPDSMQRIFMVFKGLEEEVTIPEQQLSPWERTGYSVVEWGVELE